MENLVKPIKSATVVKPILKENSGVSGEAMDRKIVKSRTPLKSIIWIFISLIVAWLIYQLLDENKVKSLRVNSERITISTVQKGTFEDFLPVRAQVKPAKTLYLDAIEGGRVERILVEDGAQLNAGDLIVELSNASLQLNVLGNEARVAEQLNNMRTIELSLEQNRLQHKRNLIDIDYQIKILKRQLSREQSLVKSGAVAQTKFDDTRDTLQWYQNRLAITLESQASDNKMQAAQLMFLQETSKRLEGNLEISRKNLDNMNVKAPVNGKLSGFNVEVGQSIGRGERLGQIDTPNDYKLTASIDEFYLGRVYVEQTARFNDYPLAISKIYPQVQNGQFQVDLKFIQQQPQDIRRGQSVSLKLTLGDANEAILIPNGAFFQETGGHWAFVVNAEGTQAQRRDIKLGRRNNKYIEVLDGIDLGERVVISSYSNYQAVQRLVVKQ
jgi:HlyD family secretion protein